MVPHLSDHPLLVFGTARAPVRLHNQKLLWRTKNLVTASAPPNAIKRIAFNQQQHGNKAAFPSIDTGAGTGTGICPQKADALVTNAANTALVILTADCLPILAFDKKSLTIGAAHAGWRGCLNGVLENTIAAMIAKGASIKNILIFIGPHIRRESFEVSNDLKEQFLKASSENIQFFSASKNGKYLLDLASFITHKAIALKIPEKHITIVARNTYANQNYFSHRRTTHQASNHDVIAWRQASFIAKL